MFFANEGRWSFRVETIRAFISVDIGDEIRGKLDALQRKLRKVHSNVRWVNPRSMHLTLAFLGEVSMEQVEIAKRVLDRVGGGCSAFPIGAVGAGFFGSPKHPRVVWAGLADCPPLMQLQDRIAMSLHLEGLPFDDKPFSPHLTLGRIKAVDHHTGPLLEKIGKYKDTVFGGTLIDHVELNASTLPPHGAEYAILHRTDFSSQTG